MKTATRKASNATTINDCNFYGVRYDAKAVETISLIAEGLVENAKALGKLAAVLQASNVTVECLVKVEQPTP